MHDLIAPGVLRDVTTMLCCQCLTQDALLQVPDAPPSKDNKGNGAGKDKKNH